MNFEKIVGREGGAIPWKYRELIAIAVACTTQCPYCLDVPTRAAKVAGATREEVTEAALLAAALRAGASVTHGALAVKLFDLAAAVKPASKRIYRYLSGVHRLATEGPHVRIAERNITLLPVEIGDRRFMRRNDASRVTHVPQGWYATLPLWQVAFISEVRNASMLSAPNRNCASCSQFAANRCDRGFR